MADKLSGKQALRIIYGASTGKDAFEDRDGKTFFAEAYISWLEDKVLRAANVVNAGLHPATRQSTKRKKKASELFY
jgi:hypothetical protein